MVPGSRSRCVTRPVTPPDAAYSSRLRLSSISLHEPSSSTASRRMAARTLVLENRAADHAGRQLLRRGIDLQVLDVLERDHQQRPFGLDDEMARLERLLQPGGGARVAVGDLL